jgi:hypothetical protein
MSKSDTVDLYAVIVEVMPTRVEARIERYKAKSTPRAFVPVRISKEEHAQGYSYCMPSRVMQSKLGRVLKEVDNPSYMRCVVPCYRDGQVMAMESIRAHIKSELTTRIAYATAMHGLVAGAWPSVVHVRVPGTAVESLRPPAA